MKEIPGCSSKEPHTTRKNDINLINAPYSSKEDREIIYFIVRNDYYPLVKGNVIWKDAEAEKICEGRTWQGLKERFRKKVLPCIRSYNFPEEIAKKFQNIPKLSKRERDDAFEKYLMKKSCLYSDSENSDKMKEQSSTSTFRYPSLDVQKTIESPMASSKNKEKKTSTEEPVKRKIVPSSSIFDYRRKSKNYSSYPGSLCSKHAAAAAASSDSKSDDEIEILYEEGKTRTPRKHQTNSKSLGAPVPTSVSKRSPLKSKSDEFNNHDVKRTQKSAENGNYRKTSRKESSSDSNIDKWNTDDGYSEKILKLVNSTKKFQLEIDGKNSSDEEIITESDYIAEYRKSKEVSGQKNVEAIQIDSTSEQDMSDLNKSKKRGNNRKRLRKSSEGDSSKEEIHEVSSKLKNGASSKKIEQKRKKDDYSSEENDLDLCEVENVPKRKETPRKVGEEDHQVSSKLKNVTSKKKYPEKKSKNNSSYEEDSDLYELKEVSKSKKTPTKARKDNSGNEENQVSSTSGKVARRKRTPQKRNRNDSSSEENDSDTNKWKKMPLGNKSPQKAAADDSSSNESLPNSSKLRNVQSRRKILPKGDKSDSSSEDSDSDKLKKVPKSKKTSRLGNQINLSSEENYCKSSKLRNVQSSREIFPKGDKSDSSSEESDSDLNKSKKLPKSKKIPRKTSKENLSIGENHRVSKNDSSSGESDSDSVNSKKMQKPKNKSTPRKATKDNLNNEKNQVSENDSDLNNLKKLFLRKKNPRQVNEDSSSNKENHTVSPSRKAASKNDKNDSSSEDSEDSESETVKWPSRLRSRGKARESNSNVDEDRRLKALKTLVNIRNSPRKIQKKTYFEPSSNSETDSDEKISKEKGRKPKNFCTAPCCQNNVIKVAKACQATWTGSCFLDEEEDFMDKCIQVNFEGKSISDKGKKAAQEVLPEEQINVDVNLETEETLEKGQMPSDDNFVVEKIKEEVISPRIEDPKNLEEEKSPLNENIVAQEILDENQPQNSAVQEILEDNLPQLMLNPMAQKVIENKIMEDILSSPKICSKIKEKENEKTNSVESSKDGNETKKRKRSETFDFLPKQDRIELKGLLKKLKLKKVKK